MPGRQRESERCDSSIAISHSETGVEETHKVLWKGRGKRDTENMPRLSIGRMKTYGNIWDMFPEIGRAL